MGADLYITPLYEEQRERWQKRFEKAVELRNQLNRGTPEYADAQQRVEFCSDKMHERGYFRDSYNESDLLWKFDLSWWEDIIPLLDEQRCLSVENATKLRVMLKEHEPDFERNLAELSAHTKRYFSKKYQALQAFLGEAIALNTPIECSL